MLTWNNADQATSFSASTLSHSLAPSNIEPGDLILAIWGVARGTRLPFDFNVPPGFKHLGFFHPSAAANSHNHPTMALAGKIAGSSEPALYDFSSPAQIRNNVILMQRIPGARRVLTYPFVTAHLPNTTPAPPPDVPAIPDLPPGNYRWVFVGVSRSAFEFPVHVGWSVNSPAAFEEAYGLSIGAPGQDRFSFGVWTAPFNGTATPIIDSSNTNATHIVAALLIPEPQEGDPDLAIWCPKDVGDPESSDLGDLGDFGEPTTPEYVSQKNLVKLNYDQRTNTVLGHRGTLGENDEEPPTNPQILRSRDCAKTWEALTDLIAAGVIEPYDTGVSSPSFLPDLAFQPFGFIPGAEPGEWIMFDFLAGYYVSKDDGVSWSERRNASTYEQIIIPREGSTWERYIGVSGVDGLWDSRHLPGYHYLEHKQIGLTYTHGDSNDFNIWGSSGVRRSLAVNGGAGWGDWDDSLHAGPLSEGGSGLGIGDVPPRLVGANGIWLLMGDYNHTWHPTGGARTPNVRINTDVNLDPSGWGDPFWLISQAFVDDFYGGAEFGPADVGDRRMQDRNAAMRLKFIPRAGHPAGGRWWLMGINDFLVYSDDNGETWSNSLADHTGPPEAMHPILNYRRSSPIGYRNTHARVLDIGHDPLDFGRLISIGITYDRLGLSNRLAVFSCSPDGGDTWGPAGQLPIRLSNIGNTETHPGHDAPAIARHIFPCFRTA